jgi:hypothetical protein
MSTVGFEDKLYPPTKIIGVVDLLAKEGIGSIDVLRGIGVPWCWNSFSFGAPKPSATR